MALRPWPILCKLIQKRTYSCLSTPSGIWFAFFGLCIIVVSAFHFGEVFLQWSMMRYAGNFHISRYYDNIAGKSFEPRLCLPQPIDIVYTWVNGSDPKLIQNLNKIKNELEAELNRTSFNTFQEKKKRGKLINDNAFKWKDKHKCPLPNCVPSNRIAVSGLNRGVTLYQVKAINSYFGDVQNLEFWDEDSDVVFISFKDYDNIGKIMNTTCLFKKLPLNISEVFYTSTVKLGHKKLDDVVMVHEYDSNSESEIKSIVSLKVKDSVNYVKSYPDQKVTIVSMSTKDGFKQLRTIPKKDLKLNGKSFKFFPVTYVWKPVALRIDNSNQDMSSNRFADNDELKYSLRSVEKFVPWIRKIFIVTNGQIPSWLDLHHPRIQLVTHDDIFVNKTHLPTFSSPAIEAHIHRIPGLSKKFIYMNDDVFFGAPVWPDDFFTHSKGHKIYLSWAVPNCNEGCPASWINDKYCDKACNVTACDYDGGDCIGKNAKKGSWNLHQQEAQRFSNSRLSEYCFKGCALNWVGDRYCDGNCNHAECAFDGGDCGVSNYHMLFSQTFKKDIFKGVGSVIQPPDGTLAMFVNFTNIFDSVIEGTFTDAPVLRNAILSKKFKVMSMTFFKNMTENVIDFQILGYRGANQTDKSVAMFKINITTLAQQTAHPDKLKDNATKEIIPTALYPNHLKNLKPALLNTNLEDNHYPESFVNITLPEDLSLQRAEIRHDFSTGDITELGYNRSLALLYQEYLNLQPISQNGRKLLWLQENNAKPSSQNSYNCLRDPDCVLSFLPWERGKAGKDSLSKIKKMLTLQNYQQLELGTRRRLFDAYSSSLLHVSRIYNKAFGYKARKVPAHMPHMVDRDIIYEMQTKFWSFFDATSSHKLRHPQDMQFAFSFNYFVIGVKKSKNLFQLFDEIDTDHSGTLNDRELRTLTAVLYPLPISIKQIHAVEENLKNCSRRLINSYNYILNDTSTLPSTSQPTEHFDDQLPLVTKDLFINCHEVWKLVNKTDDSKYQHEIMGEDDLAFKMIHNNVTTVLHQLDWVRKNRKKFICINDDLDHDRADSKTIRRVLRDFYESFFPIPSQFELEGKYKNRFLYKRDLEEWTRQSKLISDEVHFFVVLLVLVLAVYLFRKKALHCFKVIMRLFF
eukprot:TCONS_00054184-protein